MNTIEFFEQETNTNYLFTILIPSWNNRPYLELCIDRIRTYSHYRDEIQIIVFVNEGKDDTVEFLQNRSDVDYIVSAENRGICYAMNLCRKLIKSDYVMYMNDDMVVLPDWDKSIVAELRIQTDYMFYLSATMIEPNLKVNPCCVYGDYGFDLDSFKEEELLRDYKTLTRDDWNGSTWPPSVMHISLWDAVGGFSVEYSPGMYSDPDLAKKLYDLGVRRFKGLGTSLVYHFGSKSTRKIRKNKGRKIFLSKWGYTANHFMNKILKIGQPYQELPADSPYDKPTWLTKLKTIQSTLWQ